ncbi:MAG: DUF4747 family protein, partial [Anaerolineales bacterium]|nr:DUF4747 family protein [Anaerolineales bacterium]
LTEVGESFSPISVKKIFDNMFKTKMIKGMFEEINVVVFPSQEPIERILSLPYLKRLEISLLRPNDDDLESDEAKILKKLEMEHAKRKDVILTAIPRDGIVPNNETKILARVASHNGFVKANGYNEKDERVFISTKDHPWEFTVQFDPTQPPDLDVFKQTVSEIASKFKRSTKA